MVWCWEGNLFQSAVNLSGVHVEWKIAERSDGHRWEDWDTRYKPGYVHV